jgi:uncharacterized protein YjiS (DUF1127 family)
MTMTMETQMSTPAPFARSSYGFAAAAAVVRAIVKQVDALVLALRNRREVTRLLDADPAMLRDLGLTPMDLNCALAEPMWKDPSARLLVWSIERRAAARATARENLMGLAPAHPPHTADLDC